MRKIKNDFWLQAFLGDWGRRGKRKAETTHFLFSSIATLNQIENISVISMKRENNNNDKWREPPPIEFLISGGSRKGPAPPLFLDQTEARRSNFFFRPGSTPLISGSGWLAPLNWRSGSANAYTNDSYSKSILRISVGKTQIQSTKKS